MQYDRRRGGHRFLYDALLPYLCGAQSLAAAIAEGRARFDLPWLRSVVEKKGHDAGELVRATLHVLLTLKKVPRHLATDLLQAADLEHIEKIERDLGKVEAKAEAHSGMPIGDWFDADRRA